MCYSCLTCVCIYIYTGKNGTVFMFDIHSHIIYGVDDGARTLEEAADLVAVDIIEGAEAIIATPH